MTRHERKLFFERLVAMRDAYRAATHVPTTMTIDLATAFAGRLYNSLALNDAASTASSGNASTAG